MFDRLRFKARLLSLPALVLLAATTISSAQAAVQNRITASITADARTSLEGTVAPRARLASDLGAADPKLALTDMSLRFSVTPTQQAALTELLLEQQQPASPNYHKWLTPAQFADQFGLSTSDIAKVTAWLSSQGFTVTSTAPSRTFITFSGTAAQVEQAFGTSIHSLSLNGEKHFANLTDPAIPAALASVVSGVTGLHDFKPVSRVKSHMVPTPASDPVHPQFTSNLSGSIYVAPSDFYTIYDENSLISAGTTGTGVTIAVVGQTDISLPDVAAFRSAAGLAVNTPTVKVVGTDPGTSTDPDDITESQLDMEWSGATAPAASILFYNSRDVIDISLVQAIEDNLAQVITVSYGNCEAAWGSDLQSLNLKFQQAAAQGITIFSAAGDSGAADCDNAVASATNGLAVDFPGSSPFVTSVGGTMFNEGSGSFWAAVNNATPYNNTESAISYIPEAVWNETATAGTLASGGGGQSTVFTKPFWQVGTGVPNDFSRDVPDISLDAASVHEPYLICAFGSCVNGFRAPSTPTASCPQPGGGCVDVVGGTSVAAPSFAGLTALVVQKTGGRLGTINPTLYALANSTFYSMVFHDTTVGSNAVPCTAGSTGCPTGGNIGYSATTGYDLASGWGSVDATNMVNDWKLVTPLSSSTIGQTLSTVTVTSSAPGATQGTAVTITATVTSGVTTTTATPTGTAQLLVDGTASGTPVALVSGVATFSLATTTLTPGVHTVTVAYSGDSTYAGSKNSTTVDITSLSSADFSITASSTTLTIKSGATGSVTYTLKSLNNFAGAITMSGTEPNNLAANGTFSVSPVTLTAGGSGTTILTFQAFVTNGITSTGNFRAANRSTTPPWVAVSGGMTLASMLLILVPGRRRRKLSRTAGIFCMLLLSITAIGMSGCGGSSGLASAGGTITNATPGTYQLTVTATAGSVTHTSNLTLIVQ